MKKKLLFINGHLNTGGVEKSLLDVLKYLDYDRYEVDLLLLEELGDYTPELPEQVNVRLMSLKNTYGPVWKALLRCVRQGDWFCLRMRLVFLAMKFFGQKQIRWAGSLLTGKKHYHCAIGFRPGICSQIAAFATDADRRITWWHHGEITVDRQEYGEMASACHRVVSVSHVCRTMLEEAFPQLADKLVVIPNVADVENIREKALAFEPYGSEQGFRIVSVGRLAPEKHFENAIRCAAALKERGIPFCWHLVGDGVERSRLETLAEELGVTDRFVFEGNQPNPYPFLKGADLFVHPSYVESFGIVILEALALGVPCVAAKSAGACELLEHETNGLLAEKTPEALCEKVTVLLEDTELYQCLKSSAVCPEKYSADAVAEMINCLLEESE